MPQPLYHRVTEGIRVTVRPAFLPGQSRPEAGRWLFAYEVRLENVGEEGAQLLGRHWRIHDSIGEDTEVVGEGVVGLQPVLPPRGVHEYQSYCELKSPAGHMEGRYLFVRPDGRRFEVAIPRFELDARQQGPAIGRSGG